MGRREISDMSLWGERGGRGGLQLKEGCEQKELWAKSIAKIVKRYHTPSRNLMIRRNARFVDESHN